jgi:dTDP-4-dehydrorhamnose 3,5-epimerase
LRWDDPELGIAWPVTAENAVLSAKDKTQPGFLGLDAYFTYHKPI